MGQMLHHDKKCKAGKEALRFAMYFFFFFFFFLPGDAHGK